MSVYHRLEPSTFCKHNTYAPLVPSHSKVNREKVVPTKERRKLRGKGGGGFAGPAEGTTKKATDCEDWERVKRDSRKCEEGDKREACILVTDVEVFLKAKKEQYELERNRISSRTVQHAVGLRKDLLLLEFRCLYLGLDRIVWRWPERTAFNDGHVCRIA